MELMTTPRSLPPDTDLGKPLPGKQEGALVSSARDNLREGRLELDFELHILPRLDRTRQLQLEDRLVVRVTVIRRDELHLLGQVSHAGDLKGSHLVRAIILRFPLIQTAGAEISIAMRFVDPGGLLLKCIQIKVEGKTIKRLPGQVAIGQRLGGLNRVPRGIVLRINLVG